jgi:beta-N-acetylhexosaminidase
MAQSAQGPMTAEADASSALGLLMLAFAGTTLPAPMRERLAGQPAAGVTLFRYLNVGGAAELRALTDDIQLLAPDELPFVIALDQEGGQLAALGPDATPFAGPMALGAVGDADLARRVGEAIGRELRAVGVNVNYAPVCDLATSSANRSLGVRCFGDDPDRVAPLVAATVEGLAAAGVAATLKHFPGGGEAEADPHHELPIVQASAERFAQRELLPFAAGIRSGARLVMTGHPAVPALTGDERPATVSRRVVTDLLRDRLAFDGVAISDALDMGAMPQGAEQGAGSIAALVAGQDLLLLSADDVQRRRIEAAVLRAAAEGVLPPARISAAGRRVAQLRASLLPARGDSALVGSAPHRALAAEVAARAVTLLRDMDGLLPVRLTADQSVGVLMPRPVDRTPADTSAAVAPALAAAAQRRHPRVAELLIPQAPAASDIAAAVAWAAEHDLLIVGTIDASFEPGQADLVRALLATRRPVITVALRTPWDLAAYPQAGTHLCTYAIQPPSLEALTAVLWGEAPAPGRLPVATTGT